MKAALVIMAAGMGSRYGGDKQVDGLGPNNEILMEYSIYDAVRAGFTKVVLIIKPEIEEMVKGMVGELLSRLRTRDGGNVEVCYVYQDNGNVPAFYHIPEERRKPFGTCHAVLCARNAVHEPFIVINADDYYGQDAFATVIRELETMPAEGHGTMVGYLLKNTVSENGTVTRGICHIEEGKLKKVVETFKLKLYPNGDIRDVAEREDSPLLPGDTIVSMNFWGFTPWVFDKMEAYFHDFLRGLKPEDIKAECLLPSLVDVLIQRGQMEVTVLSSAARWFGVTYKEDKPVVQDAIRKLHERGDYPAVLG